MLSSLRKNAARASETPYLEVTHAGETYRILLKRIASARRFTLRVRAATRDVVLTMPPRSSISGAMTFAQAHAGWIGGRLEKLPKPTPLGPGEVVPIRGVNHLIVHRPHVRGTAWVEAGRKSVGASMLPQLCVAGEKEFVARRVKDFLVREAKRDFEAAVTRYAGKLGVTPRRVSLRDTTSRWGSCSSTGALSFSWRLIMAPSFVLDYLAAHEVSHLIHLNHSPAYWKVVGKLTPHVERGEAWLKHHGAGLLRFGPFKG